MNNELKVNLGALLSQKMLEANTKEMIDDPYTIQVHHVNAIDSILSRYSGAKVYDFELLDLLKFDEPEQFWKKKFGGKYREFTHLFEAEATDLDIKPEQFCFLVIRNYIKLAQIHPEMCIQAIIDLVNLSVRLNQAGFMVRVMVAHSS